MISEFSVRPKSQNKRAYYYFWAALAIAVATFIVYLLADKYRGLIGLGTIAAITIAVFVYTKYIAASYIYDITFDSSSHAVFVVRQQTGKKDTTLTCISLSGITSVARLSAEQRKKHITPAGMIKYVYTPTISPDSVLLIIYHSRYEKAEIYIEATDEFASLLESYSLIARSQEQVEADAEEA